MSPGHLGSTNNSSSGMDFPVGINVTPMKETPGPPFTVSKFGLLSYWMRL